MSKSLNKEELISWDVETYKANPDKWNVYTRDLHMIKWLQVWSKWDIPWLLRRRYPITGRMYDYDYASNYGKNSNITKWTLEGKYHADSDYDSEYDLMYMKLIKPANPFSQPKKVDLGVIVRLLTKKVDGEELTKDEELLLTTYKQTQL